MARRIKLPDVDADGNKFASEDDARAYVAQQKKTAAKEKAKTLAASRVVPRERWDYKGDIPLDSMDAKSLEKILNFVMADTHNIVLLKYVPLYSTHTKVTYGHKNVVTNVDTNGGKHTYIQKRDVETTEGEWSSRGGYGPSYYGYWDMVDGGWRQFRLDRLISFKIIPEEDYAKEHVAHNINTLIGIVMKYKINMQEIKDDKKNGIITKEEYALKVEEIKTGYERELQNATRDM